MMTSAPSLAAATAWLAPLPPKLVSKCEARTVSPQTGMRSTVVVRSMFVEPMTPMRGRLLPTALPPRRAIAGGERPRAVPASVHAGESVRAPVFAADAVVEEEDAAG